MSVFPVWCKRNWRLREKHLPEKQDLKSKQGHVTAVFISPLKISTQVLFPIMNDQLE